MYNVRRLIQSLRKLYTLDKWRGPPLQAPVDHCNMQPGEFLKVNKEVSLSDALLFAFQYGVCQGYELREAELRDSQEITKTLLKVLEKEKT